MIEVIREIVDPERLFDRNVDLDMIEMVQALQVGINKAISQGAKRIDLSYRVPDYEGNQNFQRIQIRASAYR